MRVRKATFLRNAQIEDEYQQIRKSALAKSSQFSIMDLNSLEDLDKYLTKDTEIKK